MKLNWNKSEGLVPAIIQDSKTEKVLMLGYMNSESLEKTLESKKVVFFSRSRQSLWVKGETSGNFFHVVDIQPDCDGDALLVKVTPEGPACHRNTETCFDVSPAIRFLEGLEEIIDERLKNPEAGSYVASLKERGLDRIAQKVGEEAVETVIASKNGDSAKFEEEAADLLFHLMVLLKFKNSSLERVADQLKGRHELKKRHSH